MGLRGLWLLCWIGALGCAEPDAPPPASRAQGQARGGGWAEAGASGALVGDRAPQRRTVLRDLEADAGDDVCSFTVRDGVGLESGGGLVAAGGDAGLALAQVGADGALAVHRWSEAGYAGSERLAAVDAQPQHPALIAWEGGWLAAWIEHSTGRPELFAQRLDGGGRPAALASRISAGLAVDGARLQGGVALLAAAGSAKAVRALWGVRGPTVGAPLRAAELDAHGRQGPVQTLGSSGVQGTSPPAPWAAPEGLGLVGVTPGPEGAVWSQMVDAPAADTGADALSAGREALDASGEPGAELTGDFALAFRTEDALVAYGARIGGVRPSVLLRRLSPEGGWGAARPLEPNPAAVASPALAAFGMGYVVAYRALPSLYSEGHGLRLAFIDRHGQVVYRVELQRSEGTDDRPAPVVAADGEGRVLVGWDEGRGQLRVVQLACPAALDLCSR